MDVEDGRKEARGRERRRVLGFVVGKSVEVEGRRGGGKRGGKVLLLKAEEGDTNTA